MGRIASYDQIFVFAAGLLLLVGIFILASASLGISAARFGNAYYYLFHQIIFGLIPGAILFFLALKLPYTFLRNWALPILILAVFLMFLVLIPGVGFLHGGARRWIAVGSLSFQPAEFLKFAYIVYLAAWLESKSKAISSFKFGFLPFVIMSAFVASFLVLQPDIGTLGVLMAAVMVIFFLSGGSFKQIILLFAISLVIIGVLIMLEPYRLNRVTVFFNPAHDPQGIGYQINQALIAVGSGGFWGRGFGLSRQKFSYLPEPIGDSIFAVLGEELGFIGGAILIVLFLIFFLRGILIVNRSSDGFGRFLGTGLLFLIMFQAFINIAAILSLIPLTGIPLPFVSYGGTALAFTIAEVGIILNISKKRI